eukprot:TRINITY_DN3348_c0_g1_i1.p1 TRINITY_DN3348_c0_g1~~TRINITY_DN3348_c0_g1_i1.p1  ORF type:complete len:252 (-),score=29.04 TRINITY_DN3348_c0_g1_i1:170-925(-)
MFRSLFCSSSLWDARYSSCLVDWILYGCNALLLVIFGSVRLFNLVRTFPARKVKYEKHQILEIVLSIILFFKYIAFFAASFAWESLFVNKYDRYIFQIVIWFYVSVIITVEANRRQTHALIVNVAWFLSLFAEFSLLLDIVDDSKSNNSSSYVKFYLSDSIIAVIFNGLICLSGLFFNELKVSRIESENNENEVDGYNLDLKSGDDSLTLLAPEKKPTQCYHYLKKNTQGFYTKSFLQSGKKSSRKVNRHL